ncbi:MAG: glycosyltransferase [Candidatus Binatia bacterium]
MADSAPVRVAYVIGELGKGGAEYQLHELVRGLDRGRFAPHVIVLAEGGYWTPRIRRLGISVLEVPRGGPADVRRLARLRAALRAVRPHVLQTIRWSGNTYGRVAALGLGIPVVIASERVHEERRAWGRRLVDRVLDPVTDAYLVNCEAIARGLTEQVGIARRKVRVITNGIDLRGFPAPRPDRAAARRALGFDPARRLVAQVGRLTAQKDYPTYLRAAAQVATALSDTDFLIVGEGELRSELERLAAELGLGERVRFLGLRHDVPALLGAVDVVVMTSVFEGFPNALLEAMASGAVVVATEVGGCPELVRPGETGVLVPPRSPQAVAAGVRRILDDAALAVRLAGAARRRVEQEFSVEVLAARTATFYDELLRLRGPRGRAVAAA